MAQVARAAGQAGDNPAVAKEPPGQRVPDPVTVPDDHSPPRASRSLSGHLLIPPGPAPRRRQPVRWPRIGILTPPPILRPRPAILAPRSVPIYPRQSRAPTSTDPRIR